MTLFAFGLNHESAPVALREAFALSSGRCRRLLERLPLTEEAEVVVISTCNRTEAVLHGTEADVAAVREALAAEAGSPWPAAHAFLLRDEDAVRHVIELTAGLRSLVLGDAQILAQVKEAYRLADDAERVGPALHRLLHVAFRAAKRVRTETALGLGAASVSSAAVAAARAHVGGTFAGRRVLLVGAGQMGTAALRALAAERPAALTVTNRSFERAAEAAGLAGAGVVAWEERHAAAAAADVVLVASGAPEPVLLASGLPAPRAPVLVVDVAVPRNVDPAVDALTGYRVLDLDHLAEEVRGTEDRRRAALPAARAQCAEALADYVAWYFHHQALQPTIHAVRATFDAIRRQELARYAHRFHAGAHAELDRLTRSIMQKLLAVPIVQLKNAEPASLDFVRGVKALARMFARPGCDEADPAEAAARAAADPRSGCPFETEPQRHADRHAGE